MTPEEALYDMAYAFRNADKPGASYHGGDVYADLMKRTEGAMERLLKEEAWETMIIVAHGGVNRFVLSWCMGSEDLRGFARWDQVGLSCRGFSDRALLFRLELTRPDHLPEHLVLQHH